MNPTSDSTSTKPTRARLQDVADAVGVTHATVYNVLNNKGRVSEAMRARVLAAARELDYRSNLLASGLKTGRSRGIGVLVHRLASVHASRQLEGAESAAREQGYHLIVSSHDDDAARAVGLLEGMKDRQLDGAVSLSATTAMGATLTAQISSLDLPFVFGLSASMPLPEIGLAQTDHVLADQQGGARAATEHLLGLGRRDVLFLGVAQTHASRQRLAGARAAHRARGLEWRDSQIARATAWTGEAGADALSEWLDGNAMPDAIVAANDRLAAGAMRVVLQRGARVPDDVAITGFDDMVMGRDLVSPLTTVEMPLHLIGRTCIERLLIRLDSAGEIEPENISLPCQLVVRESCGAHAVSP